MGLENNINMLVGSFFMIQGGYLLLNVYGVMLIGYIVLRVIGISYIGIFFQVQGGLIGFILLSVQGLMMLY